MGKFNLSCLKRFNRDNATLLACVSAHDIEAKKTMFYFPLVMLRFSDFSLKAEISRYEKSPRQRRLKFGVICFKFTQVIKDSETVKLLECMS